MRGEAGVGMGWGMRGGGLGLGGEVACLTGVVEPWSEEARRLRG